MQNIFSYFHLFLIAFVTFGAILHFATVQTEGVEVVFDVILVLPTRGKRVNDLATVHAESQHALVTAQVLALI